MPKMIVIEHRDGRRLAVTPTDFRRAKVGPDGETYEALGFKVLHYEDGEPYEAPPADGAPKPRERGQPGGG